MKVRELRRGKIENVDTGLTTSARTPINALLGLRDDRVYLAWLEAEWGSAARPRAARRWIADGTTERLTAAATKAASSGRIGYSDLADLLDRLVYRGDVVEASSLPVLAAWALEQSIKRGDMLAVCENCGRPWFTPSRSALPDSFPAPTHCPRPAPGQWTTCANLHATRRFAEQRVEWNKEYRRIYARKLRGTVSEADWQAWRGDTLTGAGMAPITWASFDTWKQRRDGELLKNAIVDVIASNSKERNDNG